MSERSVIDVLKAAQAVVDAEGIALSANRRLARAGERRRSEAIDELERKLNILKGVEK